MKKIVKGKHIDLTREMKDLAEEKLFAPLEKYIEKEDSSATIFEVTFELMPGHANGQDKMIHTTLVIPHDKQPVHIDETDSSWEVAVNKARDKVEEYLQRHKTRHNHH